MSELITTTHFELVDIDKLVPYVNNARTHSPEQINKLRASLREFGFVNPDIIDINIPERSINVRLNDAELAARPMRPLQRKREITKALRAYASMVTSADKGGVREI